MEVIRKVQYDFDRYEATKVLDANKEWNEYEEKKNAAQKELESKLEKIDPKLKSELRQLEDLYTSLGCVELEIYFAKGFKEGVRFLKDCL